MVEKNKYQKTFLIRKKIAGVNLVELMISLSIMAILAAIAAPNFTVWMNNMKIKSHTENIFTGVSEARAEAIKKNTSVYFSVDSNGSWTVNNALDDSIIFLNNQAGSINSVNIMPNPSTATKITFNGWGRVITNADTSDTIQSISIDPTSTNGNVYSSLITLNSGGGVSYCSYNPSSTHICP